jgi:LysM repeat protein
MNNRSLLIIVFLLCATSSIAQQKIRHTVQEGETIESIAKKYNITVVNLKEANPDIDMFFYTGLKLNIPQIDRIITPLEQTDSQIVKNVLQYDMKVSVTDKKEQNLSKSNKRNSNVGESIQKINSIYSANFNVSNPVESYESTKTAIIDYIKGLGSNTSQQLQDYYYEAFYDASENEQLDSAVTNAFKYLMVEGKLEEDVMWKFLVENYACDGNTESTKFLLDCFKDVSVQHNNAYSIVIESLSTKYGDVIHPLSFDKMIKGYWISLNNKYQTVRIFGKDVTSNIYGSDTKNTPDFILQINVLTDVGTTMLSSPRTPWKCKKTSGFWYYSPNIENYMMRNSQNTFCNADAKELSLTFASEKVKEGNTDRARQQIAENRQWQADMHGKIASSNTSFGNKLAGDVITDGHIY